MPIPAAAPPGDYAAEWTAIDSLERQGLFKSALERTELLSARAKKEQNTPQLIKTLLFRGKYTTQLEEDGFVKAVQIFEGEAKTAGEPEQSILHSLLGELYATYLQNQGWRIQERTPVPDGEGGDILTWSAAQLEQKALDEYIRSVAKADALRRFSVESFRAILTPGKGDTLANEALRPSLFDLLAHRALGYFANERSYLTEPAYKFYLDQPAAFDPAAEFVKTTFATRDSSSGKWLGLRLFQQLLSGPAGEAAQVSNDLLRLQFVRNNAVLEDKHNLYERALEYLHKAHYNHPVDAEIVYALAQALVDADNRATATTPTDGSLLRRAVTECEDAIRRHPNTFGAGQCQALLADIRRTSLNLEAELVSLPEKPVLLAVSYKNIDKVWVKVVSVPNDPDAFNTVEWEQRLPYLNGRPALQQRSWSISNPGDFHQHRTEIKLDALPPGRYYALVSSTEKFSDDNAYTSFVPFTCSNLAGVQFRNNGQTHFAVAHRQTGAPLAGVQADFFEYRWDRNARENARQLSRQAQSDRDGLLQPNLPENIGFSLRLSSGPDSLWLGERFSNYRNEQPYRQREAQFFTDRALYRPGQTVYFKGIVLQRDAKDFPKIVPNTVALVKFFDTNGQEKAQLKLKTNEFGTFNGAFTAPATGLAGPMRIEAEGMEGSAWFNVEEYKRPRFEVTFKPIEGAYRVNETVKVRGEAKNYAGSAVDGAQLRYRVVRQARFPWWNWWSKRFPGPTERMEIANGEAKTGADGSFEITFTALPDRSIPKKDQPLFDYQVIADVTDITGETRSSETSLSAGYIALNVDFELRAEEPLDSLSQVTITTTNTAGQFQAAAGTISVMRLNDPKQTFVERYWGKTDIQTILEVDFHRDFPNYAWNDEDNPEKWSGAEPARLINFNTATAKQADLSAGRMTPGYYRVVLQTKDAFGEAIEIKRFVRVLDTKNPATRFVEPTATLEKNTLAPGETARVWLGGKAERLSFLLVDTRGGKMQPPRWLSLSNGAQTADFPVAESDRGGFFIDAFSIKNNRFYSVIIPVAVPWSNKDLTIRYESFRDKLLPGQKEEWRIRISGPKKDKVAAEMVAALYDASLDQFLPHNWGGIRFPFAYEGANFSSSSFTFLNGENRFRPTEGLPQPGERRFDQLNWFNFPLYGGRQPGMLMRSTVANYRADGMMMEEKMEMSTAPAAPAAEMDVPSAIAGKAAGVSVNPPSEYTVAGGAPPPPPPPPAPRRNLSETVFFFPELRTDAEGNVVLKFTMNEALTRWKLLTFAHTKELEWAVSEKSVVTQKDLMIITNPPRFLREGDALEFTAKVSNLSQAPISGTATLKLFDAGSMVAAEGAFGLGREQQVVSFSVPAGQSAPVSWRLRVPDGGLNGLTWQVFAEGKTFTDGEENTLPVLSNRMLVTETLPITVRGNQSKTVVFENLKNSSSGTLRSERYTLEFTSNPAWYAVQALPYLMEFPHECTEQIFSRFYANALASSVTQKMPNLRRIYDKWKGTNAMKSNLSKNQELKTALLEETPWVLDAQSEEQQKQNIALLFDLNRMGDEQERVLATLSERQAPNGGWPWFPGGREDWYITQYIVTGFGHLDKLGALSTQNDPRTAEMWNSALAFCDEKVREHYRELEKAVEKGKAKWDDDHLDGLVIQYLYARSFAGLDASDQVVNYYLGQAEKYWLGKGLYQEGLLALALHRSGRAATSTKIVASLRERALVTEELGMYWPFDWGMYWYQLPIETQALMVEVFDEAGKDPRAVEELRVWLLKNKQTNRWESTKATAEAVYALLLHGDNWLNNTKPVQVSLGGKTLKPAEYEPGTGYFKESWAGKDVKSNWSTIKVENPNSNLVWGAAYWQYFEDLDKIKSFRKTPLTIVKQLYREENSATGPKLVPIGEGSVLHPGDKIKVRIEIRVDRQMEYVHLKDMRASGLEPLNVLSGYRWQDGLGYYESTKDLATHFFIDYLPRGTFVFEYPLVVSHRGDFSNGITTLQCMYAPEFTSHSQGIRVKVE
ncbi:MAG: alpha-2-macroglobulin [Saprospiraceae bacterium]|nr:alpha-2-macroglobulin [Saprospiraceae bacterium]